MSITYRVITGDTFDLISRKTYGTEKESSRIVRANPGVVEPLTPGTSIAIPDLPGRPQNVKQSAASTELDEVAILIEGVRFRFWSEVRLTRSIDSMDTIEFSAPFQSTNAGFRESFRPFSFKTVEITIGGEPLFTGTMVDVLPILENDNRTLNIAGYSLPGVLEDCTPPASSFQLEQIQFDDAGLRDIATTLAAPFGISVDFQAEQGSVFERVAISSGQKILAFLTGLAKQRNLIITSSPKGALVFLKSAESGNPVAVLRQGASPVMSVVPSFISRSYYSDITGIEPTLVGLSGSRFTVRNPRLTGVVRPFTFTVPDTLDADMKQAVEAKAGKMFGNMVTYSVTVDTWRDPAGNIWEPNTLIKLNAPDAMVYTDYEFVVRSIEFNRDSKSETAILKLVIPGAFSGKIPETLPWDE